MSTGRTSPGGPGGDGARGLFLPLLLLSVGALGALSVQAIGLLREYRALAQTSVQQAAMLDAAYKLRQAADSLMPKVKALADKGNADAQVVVSELKQRGIGINPDATTPTPP